MKKRMQNLGALLLALALSLSLVLPAAAAEESRLDAIAAEAAVAVLSSSQASQVGWAVWRDGEIISSGSRMGSGKEAGVGDAYCIGSVSKIYTTVAVMQLAEEGKLSLDKPVVQYLPSFKMADPRYQDITVRMLLNHSSGLMGSSFGSGMLFGDPSQQATDSLLEILSHQRLKADPGAYSTYCNDGFTLAQLVVEAVTDMNFMDYLHENIFDPAGLEETWDPAENFESRRVPIHQPGIQAPLPKECMGVIGAGGLYATPEDVAAFGGALTDSTLLKKSSRDAMAVAECEKGVWPKGNYPTTLAFGLGWDHTAWYPFGSSGITALMKGGDIGYYHAGLVVLPEHRLAAAVLSTGGASTYNEMAASQMLLEALREKDVEVAELRYRLPAAKKAALPQELKPLAGYYAGQTVMKVALAEDGTLSLSFPDTPSLPARTFSYHDDGTFRDSGGTSALRLVKESNGQTYLYQWAFSTLPGLGGLPTSNYGAMRLPDREIDPELQRSWEEAMARTVFLPVSERYTSEVYLSLGMALSELGDAEEAMENAPGYIGNLRIDDKTHASYVVQAPGTAGRDGYDVELRRDEKGALWMLCSNGSVGLDLGAVPDLSAGKNDAAACTIQPDGNARWYKVGDKTAGRTMTVQVPENGGFWVYDAKGNVEASSVLWDSTSAKLPENGLVVFAGDPGARFELTFQ